MIKLTLIILFALPTPVFALKAYLITSKKCALKSTSLSELRHNYEKKDDEYEVMISDESYKVFLKLIDKDKREDDTYWKENRLKKGLRRPKHLRTDKACLAWVASNDKKCSVCLIKTIPKADSLSETEKGMMKSIKKIKLTK